MNEQDLVDQMLAMGANNTPAPASTDPVPPVQSTGSPESAPVADQAPEGAPTAGASAVTSAPPPADPAPASAPVQPADKPVNLEETFDKSSKAFAAQRLQLKNQNDLMMRFAAMANIPAANPEEAYSKLSGIVTQQEAKAKNLDPLVLRTLQDQEAKLAAYEQEEIKKEANASFLDLQKQFKLEPRDLESFARQLSKEGVNPFTQRGINLSQHYLSLNYQKLMDRAKEQGRAEEAERQKRVAQSTTPGQQTGQSPDATPAATQQPTGNGFDDFAKILGIR